MVDDLRYAVRSLLSSRGFTVVALLVIALSVGAIAPIFAIVDAVSLRQLPYPDSDRLVIIRDTQVPEAQTGRLPMSQRNYFDWAEHEQGLDSIAAVRGGRAQASNGEGLALDVLVGRVTGDFFSVFRQVPQEGRLITPDDVLRERRVVVLSHGLWQRLFGGRPDAVGRLLTISADGFQSVDAGPYEIIGITRPNFGYPAGSSQPNDVYLPLVVPPAQRTGAQRASPFLTAIGRLHDGVTLAEAQAALDGVALNLQRAFPGWEAGVLLQPYHEYVTGRTAKWMRLLLWGVALVFLIMCANVANLLLARGGARRKEIGMRAALGASRLRIARQLIIESLVLAAAGTLAGTLLGWWLLEIYRNSIPALVPRASEIGLDWRLLGIAAASALVTGGLFGLAPAVFSTRVDLTSALKSGSTGSTATAGSRLRSALIVAEVAAALVLLVGALLFTTSFMKVASVPLGVDYRNVVVAPLSQPPRPGGRVVMGELWARSEQFHSLAARIVERLRAVPGVDDVAASSGTPFQGGSTRFSFELPGKPDFKWSRERGTVAMKMVSPNYLQLLRVPLLRGRYLNERDSRDAEGAIVVSESAARMIWPGEDPMGQEIDLQKRLRVVGLVADMRMGGPENDPWPDVYVPMLQGRGTMVQSLAIRTSLPAARLLPSLRAAIQEVDPSQRVSEEFTTTLESRLAGMLAQRRFNMFVVGSFGAIGVLIAAIGLYGVMTYLVTQRTHEIGVRMALGASRGRVLRLVLGRAVVLVSIGLAAGGAGVWYFGATASAFLFQLEPLDLRVIAAAVVLIAGTALAAALVPARRAASVDPLIALRQD